MGSFERDVEVTDCVFLACLDDHYHGALFFQHRFNPKMVERPAKVAVLDHPKPEKLTLSQILRFWAQSAGLENQKIILKNPVPLCIQQEWGRKFPFNQKKCGYMKAFVCSK